MYKVTGVPRVYHQMLSHVNVYQMSRKGVSFWYS